MYLDSIRRWFSAKHTCAAGPWKDGPPPKDGEEYFVITPQHTVDVTYYGVLNRAWHYGDRWTDEDPINHAEIKLPEESEKARE